MFTSYHVHSRWSDGEADIAGYIKAAREMGLDEIGMSDHYVLSRDGAPVGWSMPVEAIGDYVEAVQSAAGKAGVSTIVRLGLEADFIPETTDRLQRILDSFPFDYVIGSVHFVDHYPVDSSRFWPTVAEKDRDMVIRAYWMRIREMAESGIFDITAHLDITKKYGVQPLADMSDVIGDALDAIARADMAIELNTSGWYAPAKEQYPAPSILTGACERGIPVVITADAHTPENLTRGFEDACRLLINIGYDKIVSYAGRQRYEHKLICG